MTTRAWRRRPRQAWIDHVFAALLVALTAIALVGLIRHVDATSGRGELSAGSPFATIVLAIVGVGMVIWGGVRVVRSSSLRPAWRQPSFDLDRARRRSLYRRIRRGEAVSSDRAEITARLATNMVAARSLVLGLAGLVVLNSAQVLDHQDAPRWTDWLLMSSDIVFLPLLLLTFRDAHRAQAWLDAHQE